MATRVPGVAVGGLFLAWLAFWGAAQAGDVGAAQAASGGGGQAAEGGAEALARYREAARRSDDPRDWYNFGTSLLQAGRWEEAREALGRAAGAPASRVPADRVRADRVRADRVPADRVPADRVRAFGRYNYGLASALDGRRGEGEADARRGRLVEARDAFRDVLRGDPRDEDARWNLELVQRWLREPPAGGGGSSEDPAGAAGAAAGGEGGGLPREAGEAGGAVQLGAGEAEALLDAAGRAESSVRERLLGRARLRDPVVERNW